MKELLKSLKNGQWYLESLEKVGEGYKKLMSDGLALIHPVSIDGRTLSDDGIPYHATIKAFDKDRDSVEVAHQLASNMKFSTPDASKVLIEPKIYKDRNGDDVHVLAMHGEDADNIVDQYSQFAGMGWPPRAEGYKPHITVDEATYNRAIQTGAKTAADMGVVFGAPELRRGFNTISRYDDTNG